ncbi:hypothetical protein [Streptomyces sp. SP18CS02]|uniref:hypothetical protein n=1 Tax=Streptomyces sp. SP18CS02 TaxID=3002531 RepID=UPI002E79FFCA|nr:hypothetical protein [Streptomyces sp. SP18CS02]MEE1753967.1 hypothetical protein [Streptomyces sp. SP18CS02]
MRILRALAATALITITGALPAAAATALPGGAPVSAGTAIAQATVTIDIGAGVSIEIINGIPYYNGVALFTGQTIDSGIFIHYDGTRLYTRTQGGSTPYSIWDARTGRSLGTQPDRPTPVPAGTTSPGPARGGVGGSNEEGNTTEIVVGAALAATALGLAVVTLRRRAVRGDH